MIRASIIPLLGGVLLARAEPRQPTQLATRDVMTCEQTYGQGWSQCGRADSTFCYNPSAGQTCCTDDAGYCDEGTYCAPVAGYCCVNGEDLATCARNSGFDLPASILSGTGTRTITLSTTVTLVSATGASSTGLELSTAAVGGFTTTYAAAPATITAQSNGSGCTNSSSGFAGPSPSVVQVSVAMKEQWTLAWMTAAMGVVGVFMATC